MLVYEGRATIRAPADKIWKILMDTAKYPEWDPHCDRIEGAPALGTTLRAYTKLSPGRAFPAKVTTLDAARKMVWTGGMPLGLFKGERTFLLEPADGGTAFTVREAFTGPLLFMLRRSIPDMTGPFRDFADGLKRRAETP